MAQVQQVGQLMVVGVPLARRRDDDHTALRVGFDYRLDLFELFGSRDGGAAEFCDFHSYSSTAAKNISAPFSLCFAANACNADRLRDNSRDAVFILRRLDRKL